MVNAPQIDIHLVEWCACECALKRITIIPASSGGSNAKVLSSSRPRAFAVFKAVANSARSETDGQWYACVVSLPTNGIYHLITMRIHRDERDKSNYVCVWTKSQQYTMYKVFSVLFARRFRCAGYMPVTPCVDVLFVKKEVHVFDAIKSGALLTNGVVAWPNIGCTSPDTDSQDG